MKCVKRNKQVKRVSDEEASALVKQGWAYCPKHEWKIFLKKGGAS